MDEWPSTVFIIEKGPLYNNIPITAEISYYYSSSGHQKVPGFVSPVINYESYFEVGNTTNDILFLDQTAIKSLIKGFPASSEFICISLDRPTYYLIIIAGIIRRLMCSQVRIESICKLRHINGSSSSWLVLRRQRSQNTYEYYLDESIGIQGFINFMSSSNVNYLVSRFFRKLPALNSSSSDLDLLVADEDIEKVQKYLMQNPGSIRVDVWSASQPDHWGMPYFPPFLAHKSLSESVLSACGAKIPNPENSFKLLAYHLVYHKGYLSGLAQSQSALSYSKQRIKYQEELDLIANEASIKINDYSLETLEVYLDRNMLKPSTDTLLKISEHNSWLKDHLSSQSSNGLKDGLYCYLIKRHAEPCIDYETTINYLNNNNFVVFLSTCLDKEQIFNARTHLRGGNWNQPYSAEINDVLMYDPVYLIVFGDPYNRSSRFIAHIKSKLRNIIDNSEISKIHSTDYTLETIEYLDSIDLSFKDDILDRWSVEVSTKPLFTSLASIFNRIKSHIYKVSYNIIEDFLSH